MDACIIAARERDVERDRISSSYFEFFIYFLFFIFRETNAGSWGSLPLTQALQKTWFCFKFSYKKCLFLQAFIIFTRQNYFQEFSQSLIFSMKSWTRKYVRQIISQDIFVPKKDIYHYWEKKTILRKWSNKHFLRKRSAL